MDIIIGANYVKKDGSGEGKLVAASTSRFFLEDNIEVTPVDRAEFYAEFVPTGEHDHENYCCRKHHTHVNPHKGCPLR